MNTHAVKRLALVLAIQAEVEGMKFENLRLEQFNVPHAYTNSDFYCKAEELRIVAAKHDDEL